MPNFEDDINEKLRRALEISNEFRAADLKLLSDQKTDVTNMNPHQKSVFDRLLQEARSRRRLREIMAEPAEEINPEGKDLDANFTLYELDGILPREEDKGIMGRSNGVVDRLKKEGLLFNKKK